ncbi:efflux RND transporter permease subunit [Roseomonas terrae]|jgi:HAE1 family hydrophobic/amphiphilic exporter-1|uniref:Efflux RND transporter permease subunit n=1 Tax=Neoroseomonas terrae TaxID=424799 RepID=A0ABS5EFQ4_9PROT|nr:efflux RND transporter permease subunit [Neoroseomonas terrae]MBR0649838.1 efflux RND transporter permease subunit [Neoroseomonas terrae]
MSIAPDRGNISAWSIRNPVATSVLFILLAISGIAAWPMLRVNGMPDVDLPVVTITVTQPGAAPTELETQVTRRIEDAVAGISDIRHIYSAVTDGVSTTIVEFWLGKGIDEATNEVRDRIGQIRTELPADITEPVIRRMESAGGAILTYTVAAPGMSAPALSWFVDDTIVKALLSVRGVAGVARIGGADREIRVALRPDRLLAFGITANQVNAQLRQGNINLPAGRMTLGSAEQSLRTLGSAATVGALRARRILLPDGRAVRLDSLAEVTDGTAETRTAARRDGRPVIAFEVSRSRGSSEVHVADGIEARLRTLGAAHPDVTIRRVATTVTDVLDGYHAALEALVVGALLAMLVVWIFLRDWPATWIAALAMPLSLLPTIAVIWLAGFSLNSVTLLGLTLVVGVLVDDAIVEIENMVRHLRAAPEQGPRAAAFAASAEIGLAVMATTATILAVFVPVAFMPGVVGQFFREFGLTVAAAVAFSLVVARMLTPLLGAHYLRVAVTRPSARREGRIWRAFLPLLSWSLRHRFLTLAGAMALMAGTVALVPLIPQDFMPASDGGRTTLALELPPGTPLSRTERSARAATEILQARPEVASVFVSLGTIVSGEAGIGASTRTGEPRMANFIVTLRPRGERSLTQQQIEAALRPALRNIPGARIHFGADGQGGSRLQATLVGDDAETLAAAGRELERQMREVPHFAAVRSTASLQRLELQIVPDIERAADAGVTTAAIAAAARIGTTGDVDQNLARFDLPGRQIHVRTMLDEQARQDPHTLRQLRVESGTGDAVPLGNVAEIRLGSGPSSIDRLDRARRITVEAELGAMPLGEALAIVDALPIMQGLPGGVRRQDLGDAETMAELFAGFGMALGAGVLLIYLVLVLLFGGFLQPLTIMAALPLSFTGALLALLVTQQPIGISAVIGLLMLMGIVAKNSILLVEYAIMARRENGLGRDAAMLEAVRKRARPVIMTTIAMCAGMAHIAMGIGADAEFRAPMAIVAMGGLATSTLLSLLVVPVVYNCMDDVEVWLTRRAAPRGMAAGR